MQPVNERAILGTTLPSLILQLQQVLQQFGYRINRIAPIDGSEPFTGSVTFEQNITVDGVAVIGGKDFTVGNATQLNAVANRGNITANGANQAIFQLGIGGTRVAYLVADITATPDLYLSNVRNGDMILATNDTERVRITKTGGVLLAAGLGNYANDAAAAAGSVAINQLYRNGSVVMIRVS